MRIFSTVILVVVCIFFCFSHALAKQDSPLPAPQQQVVSYLEIVILDPVIRISTDMHGENIDNKMGCFVVNASAPYTIIIDERDLSNGIYKIDGSPQSYVKFRDSETGHTMGGTIFLAPDPEEGLERIWWDNDQLSPRLSVFGPPGRQIWGLGGKLNPGGRIIPAGVYSLSIRINAFLLP